MFPSGLGPGNSLGLGILAPPRLNVFLELVKIRISALSTLSAATGYVVFLRHLNPAIATMALGVMCLAMGACAINQAQDRDIDRLMERTRRRPIPSGALQATTAMIVAVLLVLGGFLLLWLRHNLAAATLGLLSVAWYNGCYTYLKRIWAFAAVPGALVGAVPPAVGWTAAGGDPLDPRLLGLLFFFFIWQVPHFWLLLFEHGGDYEKAGLPSLTRTFNVRQLTGLTLIWMLAATVSSLLLPLYGLTCSPWISLGLVASGAWFVRRIRKWMSQSRERQFLKPVFRSINLYALCVMALLFLDTLL